MGRMPEYDVLATGRDEFPRFSGGSCGYMQLDITDADATSRVFVDFAPDVVINCAAMTQVDECESNREDCWRINALAVETLAKCCLPRGTRLIQVSTDFVFDGLAGPYKETARPNPLSYYGRSKLAGENYARGAGMDKWAIVRTVLVYGAGEGLQRSNFVWWLKERLEAGKPVQIVTDQWRTPTYAPDLAQGIEKVVRFRKHGVYHVSGRAYYSVYEFARVIAETLDLDASLISPTDSSSFTQPAARPAKSGFIILKAESELGYSPHSTKEAILEMVKEVEGQKSSL
jgi:dTDP-4-dehydrorhamnose reductase